ncbi:TetR/AcrR family transcriptional regulator [Nonomuraea rhodomycinica]|uniref:TetR/AcrR family transcriptional regulator n=1 Tax=Nonomuraea rhodomycinica TaxID=1712872 RepID=A0A7Y6M9Q5_9ACTN|nr:TetR/AcrR family transcriptional regulator [Nonomuraea rhodomycinica]NUW39035.1 TetR/AcrR family transcriptional regulator [Nonomuraea rhodomycinica]
MGRPGKFTEDLILDAATAITAEEGPAAATMAAIAGRLGAPTGSIYHRFASRDLLMAALWLRGVRRFQHGVIEALAAGDVEAAALHTPRWCRDHLAEAATVLLHRRELVARWPGELAGELEGVNTGLSAALDVCAARLPGVGRERLVFAVVDLPYGAVRRHLLARQPPPPLVDELVARACRAVLEPAPEEGTTAEGPVRGG